MTELFEQNEQNTLCFPVVLHHYKLLKQLIQDFISLRGPCIVQMLSMSTPRF